MGSPGSIFLSYASEDYSVAKRLSESLRAAGVEVWLDQSELRGGDSWDHRIAEQIRACSLFIALVSQHTEARVEGYFRREWGAAADRTRDLAEGTTFLLPVVVDRTTQALARVPGKFREVQWTRLPDGQTTPEFMRHVEQLLRTRGSATPMPPSVRDAGHRVSEGSRHADTQLNIGSSSLRTFRLIAALLLTAALLATASYLLLPGFRSHPSSDLFRDKPILIDAKNAPTASGEKSIAVLPFADLSQQRDQSYFSDGLSEEVIDRLAQILQLRVIARTSSFAFKDSHAGVSDIARQLNVTALLEGSVRRSADRIRVSAQLIRAADSSYLWSGTFERKLTDIFLVQDEIASAVVAALKVKLEPTATDSGLKRYRPPPEAYDMYLLGRQLMRTRPDHYEERSVEAFSKAVTIDQNYAAAYAALAFSLSFVAEEELDPRVRTPLLDKALTAAERAVAIGPFEPDAFATRGFLRFEARWDVPGADEDLSKSLQMDPTAGPTLTKYAFYLMVVGRSNEALALTKKIKETDPFFAPPWETEAHIQAGAGDYDLAEDSIRHAHSILQLDPESGELMATVALLKGQPERARILFKHLQNRAHSNWGMALSEQDLNDPAAAKRDLQVFASQSPYEYYKLAAAYARWGERDAAFAALKRAYETHDPDLEFVLIDPLLANLRPDPRYGRLLARMGLAAPKPHAQLN